MLIIFKRNALPTLAFIIISFSAYAKPLITSSEYSYHNTEYIIHGVNFGSGPNIAAFENFENEDEYSSNKAQSLKLTSKDWIKGASIVEDDKKNKVHQAKSSLFINDLAQLNFIFDRAYQEIFYSFSVKIPNNATFPGSATKNKFPDMSSWKMSWLMSGAKGFEESGKFDVCMPSHVGKGNFLLGGNSGNLTWLPHGDYWFDFKEYNHISNYVKIDHNAPSSSPIDYYFSVANSRDYLIKEGAVDAKNFSSTDYQFDRLNIPGWWGNGNNEKFNAYYDNIYIAVGKNSLARILLTDNEKLAYSQTQINIPFNSWETNKISIPVNLIPIDKPYFIHVYDSLGRKSTPALRVCPSCPKSVNPI